MEVEEEEKLLSTRLRIERFFFGFKALSEFFLFKMPKLTQPKKRFKQLVKIS
jgi:hypothetical protein